MRLLLIVCFLNLTSMFAALEEANRKKRVISVFNVVQFQNEPCVTQSTTTNGNRFGSCLTAEECRNGGGQASGSCASGFGACCLFTTSTCGATVNRNCTYFRNPGFPAALTGTNACSFTVQRADSSVCQLKLDFESFQLAGISDAVNEAMGGACIDTFTITGLQGGRTVPTICGVNTGQHMYVDLSGGGTSANLAFTFGAAAANTMRSWEIKATQIECSSRLRAPDGCLQYFTGCTGMITSFNFNNGAGNHLANQCYTSCIRQEEGFCCVKYQQCTQNQFTFDTGLATAGIDSQCVKDFIIIESSSSDCCVNAGSLTQRYCGAALNDNNALMLPVDICDCTPPFEVGFVTDNLPDVGNMPVGSGVCLKYMQVPCGSAP